MWCTTCRQDVPGIAGEDAANFVCARCGDAAKIEPTTSQADEAGSESRPSRECLSENDQGPSTDKAAERPSIELDSWQFDEDVRQAEYTLGIASKGSNPTGSFSLPHAKFADRTDEPVRSDKSLRSWRSDMRSPASLGSRDTAPIQEPSRSGPLSEMPDDRENRSGLMAWSVLSVGIMVFVCGVVLLGMSSFEGRQQLWDRGLPITIIGQAVLLIGMMLQVERVWHNSRRASERLRNVGRQLTDLQQTTAVLENRDNTTSQAFYTHMSEGANPHLLLADLKGQLDMLSVKVARGD